VTRLHSSKALIDQSAYSVCTVSFKKILMLIMLTESGTVKESIIRNTSNLTQVVFSLSPLQTVQQLPRTICGNAFPRFRIREHSNLHPDGILPWQVLHLHSLASDGTKLGSKATAPSSSIGAVSVVNTPLYCFRSSNLYMFRFKQKSNARREYAKFKE